ncbi:hypothetical protein [Rhodovulum viride]|uniref:hypothetical protein n=1 Tax=Rhodovulum viride TaxID=1231134 RepID=UPI0011BFE5B8|nr:hypothetical protein [Rhodovulum viride]
MEVSLGLLEAASVSLSQTLGSGDHKPWTRIPFAQLNKDVHDGIIFPSRLKVHPGADQQFSEVLNGRSPEVALMSGGEDTSSS